MKLLDNEGRSAPLPGILPGESYARVGTYRYKFTEPDSPSEAEGIVWDREKMGMFYPKRGVASIDSLRHDLPPDYPM